MPRRSAIVRWSFIMWLAVCAESRVDASPLTEDVESTTTVQMLYSKWSQQFNCSDRSKQSDRASSDELKEIRLINCTIPELHANVFNGFGSIKTLTIRNSELRRMDTMSLYGLRQLESLAVTSNHLSVVEKWSPHYFNTLETLDFTSNDISELNEDALQPYPNVHTFTIAHNRIKFIPNGFFRNTSRLSLIDLSYNEIAKISSEAFVTLIHLMELSLSHNEIHSLGPDIFQSNKELHTLRLDGNYLQILDGHLFSSVPHLGWLNLSGNALAAIDCSTFELNHELISLDLSDNQLVELKPDWASGIKKMELLYLNHNQLSTLTFLEHLVHLKTLQVCGNLLKTVPLGSFDKLVDLQQLSLAQNKLSFIDVPVFASLHLLRSIDVSHNDLRTAQFLQPLNKLRYLSMAYNKFETINLTLFFQFHNVELTGNPWSCTWLIEEMVNAAEGIHFGRNYSIDGRDSLHHGALTVPGIDCTDESGKRRSIVVLQMPAHERNAYTDVTETKHTESAVSQQNKNIRKMLDDEFDYKSCLIWVAIAVIAVFGIVHLGKILFNRSELSSEKYRLSQQVTLLPTIETNFETPSAGNNGSKLPTSPSNRSHSHPF